MRSLVAGIRTVASPEGSTAERAPLSISDTLAFLDANPQALVSGYALERRKAVTPFVAVTGSDDGNEADEMDADEPPTPRLAVKAELPPPPRIVHPPPVKVEEGAEDQPANGSG